MMKHRSHSATFRRQVAKEFIAGETLHGLPGRHGISRPLIPMWIGKFEAGAPDEAVQAVALIQKYEERIAALERLVGKQAHDGARTVDLLRHCHGRLGCWEIFTRMGNICEDRQHYVRHHEHDGQSDDVGQDVTQHGAA